MKWCNTSNTSTVLVQAINELIPSLADKIQERGGYLVMRPDSGDPVEVRWFTQWKSHVFLIIDPDASPHSA